MLGEEAHSKVFVASVQLWGFCLDGVGFLDV